MAFRSTAEEMERLQLSDDDTEDLWNSPSKRVAHKSFKPKLPEENITPEPRATHDSNEPLFDHQEAREDALRTELEGVRNINEVIEGLLSSLDSAKGNMETVSRTVTSASTLLNTWTRILSQTEHNQRLILNPNWQGATQDVIDIENEAIQRQQAAERREQALQQQREAAARKAEEIEKRRAQVTRGTRGTRGTTRGTVRSTGLGRTPSVSTSRTATRGGSTTTTQRPASGIARGGGIPRGRGRDQSPELERALSPPPFDSRRTSPNLRSPRASADLPSPSHFAGGGHGNTGYGRDLEGGHVSLGAFETSLPIRMDIEAALAYLLLPPAGGVFLLLTEHKSDYLSRLAVEHAIRCHVIHLLFSWSSFLSWTLLIVDLGLIGFLGMHAYQDVDTLDHFEVPIFGHLANSFVDDE
ncbi:uncharacterized protein N7515_004406 [Penicillium bovifimosum]|uniref:DASH complex subunit DUO1 n=1 Tax=Penicillium bovifimosum TaxID=126998 RepID=A0A9W9H1G5_9EURO|nr:uncharacterized protein N7515_004406 [Penicillium bovifimosum]KAJ5135128.1 hypothetical protein N7515_004406 [Penicillium bovifimosum]